MRDAVDVLRRLDRAVQVLGDDHPEQAKCQAETESEGEALNERRAKRAVGRQRLLDDGDGRFAAQPRSDVDLRLTFLHLVEQRAPAADLALDRRVLDGERVELDQLALLAVDLVDEQPLPLERLLVGAPRIPGLGARRGRCLRCRGQRPHSALGGVGGSLIRPDLLAGQFLVHALLEDPVRDGGQVVALYQFESGRGRGHGAVDRHEIGFLAVRLQPLLAPLDLALEALDLLGQVLGGFGDRRRALLDAPLGVRLHEGVRHPRGLGRLGSLERNPDHTGPDDLRHTQPGQQAVGRPDGSLVWLRRF